MKKILLYGAPSFLSALLSGGVLSDFLVWQVGGLIFWIPYWLACWLSDEFSDVEIGPYKQPASQIVIKTGISETRIDI